MTFKRTQAEGAPFYDLDEITLSDAARHFSADSPKADRELRMFATHEYEHFLCNHENVEMYYEKSESISLDDQPDHLNILIRLEGDPIG